MRGAGRSILFHYRGREIAAEDLSFILTVIVEHQAKGRSHISRVLCEHWGWRQGNGGLKEYAARDLLLRLEEAGHITLPPRLRVKNNNAARSYEQIPLYVHRALAGRIDAYAEPVLCEAKGGERYLWDYLVHHYHYLGNPKLVGEYLKQLVIIDGQVVACVGWASGAWKVACRDAWIGWGAATRRRGLYRVVNNVRFLVLPWVRIEHLASKVLSLSLRGLSEAWQKRYGHGVDLAETFVDPLRFSGTCYRAANWQVVGQTRGHAKRGNRYCAHGESKTVLLYPLHRHWRRALLDGVVAPTKLQFTGIFD